MSQQSGKIAFVMPKGYVCYRPAGQIRIDGRLDEASWENAPWTDDFVDIEGDIRPKPRFRTRAKMLWDDDYFYIGAELEEPHVWATLTEHDSVIFQDNDFEVFIDPNGDNHEYYEIEINALNTEWDLLLVHPYKDGGPAVNGWEIPGLKTAVYVDGTLNDPRDTDKGWSIEFAFPWKALVECAGKTVPPVDSDQWRIDFSRVEWEHEIVVGKYRRIQGKREDNWVWSPQGVIDMHRPETWGYVQFSTARPGEAQFRPDPSAPARAILHKIYYAQQEYRKEKGAWAKTLEELSLHGIEHESLVKLPQIETTATCFEAIAEIRLPDGKAQKWHIRHDSKVWSD